MTINAWRVFRRHLHLLKKTWMTNLMFNFIEPFLYLVAMGFGLGNLVQEVEGVSYLQFIGLGMIASSAMWAATFEATYGSFVRLHYQKTYHAMLAAPATVADVVFGDLLFASLKSLIFGAVILIVVTGLGLVHSAWALCILPFLPVHGFFFATVALTFTGWSKHIDYFNYYITLFSTPLFLFSGIFFPVGTLPGWAQTLAWLNPLYHSVEVVRQLGLGRPEPVLLLHLLVLVLLSAALAWAPVRLMEKRLIQ
ncbi:ABC transporter permease [Heliobacterium gestii]|uniref:Transport permease protein n=1 Tax=Heliomicrobium gestii TaxID=2699 RepID=A0A845LD63_HELGE|nr:ABC transporter permease [Heliomicrobium gestii]MBM7867874.1 lipooligosaccharide transport system permease protein [Heliomicrobium gestii]MZP43314.1 ABC transporter permease [Heliomicrobium gestii]